MLGWHTSGGRPCGASSPHSPALNRPLACTVAADRSIRVGKEENVRLGELEALVMTHIWDSGKPVSVREVLEALHGERELAYTTVMTVLDNLHRKDMVVRQMEGRAYLYSPALSREEYTAQLIAAAVDDSSDRTAALLHFMGTLNRKELERIRAALQEPSQETNSKKQSIVNRMHR